MKKRKKKMNADRVEPSSEVNLSEKFDESANSVKENNSQILTTEIEQTIKDLTYISETDAEILLFVGNKADSLTKETLLSQLKIETDVKIVEKDFTEFFKPLITLQDWFGDEEKAIAAKFSVLCDLLKNNLKDLKAFKIGKINLDIYVIGLDSENILTGIQTKSVET